MGAVDMVQTCLEQHAKQHLDAELKHFQRLQAGIEAFPSKALLKSDSSPSSCAEGDYDPLNFLSASTGAPASKRVQLNIILPRLSSALDRTNLSSRNATFILNKVASSLRHAVTDLSMNRRPFIVSGLMNGREGCY